jgi:hypothetical protein
LLTADQKVGSLTFASILGVDGVNSVAPSDPVDPVDSVDANAAGNSVDVASILGSDVGSSATSAANSEADAAWNTVPALANLDAPGEENSSTAAAILGAAIGTEDSIPPTDIEFSFKGDDSVPSGGKRKNIANDWTSRKRKNIVNDWTSRKRPKTAATVPRYGAALASNPFPSKFAAVDLLANGLKSADTVVVFDISVATAGTFWPGVEGSTSAPPVTTKPPTDVEAPPVPPEPPLNFSNPSAPTTGFSTVELSSTTTSPPVVPASSFLGTMGTDLLFIDTTANVGISLEASANTLSLDGSSGAATSGRAEATTSSLESATLTFPNDRTSNATSMAPLIIAVSSVESAAHKLNTGLLMPDPVAGIEPLVDSLGSPFGLNDATLNLDRAANSGVAAGEPGTAVATQNSDVVATEILVSAASTFGTTSVALNKIGISAENSNANGVGTLVTASANSDADTGGSSAAGKPFITNASSTKL